jgi:hypothetical protein
MKLSGDWVHPKDETDILPDELRLDTLRRRRIVRIGGAAFMVFFVALLLAWSGAMFFAKVWLYGHVYQELFR